MTSQQQIANKSARNNKTFSFSPLILPNTRVVLNEIKSNQIDKRVVLREIIYHQIVLLRRKSRVLLSFSSSKQSISTLLEVYIIARLVLQMSRLSKPLYSLPLSLCALPPIYASPVYIVQTPPAERIHTDQLSRNKDLWGHELQL